MKRTRRRRIEQALSNLSSSHQKDCLTLSSHLNIKDMTTKDRLDELTQRIARIEDKLWPKATQRHHFVSTKTAHAAPQAPEVKPLTAEEEAFCQRHSIETQQYEIRIHLQNRRLSAADKAAIDSISKKRSCDIKIFN